MESSLIGTPYVLLVVPWSKVNYYVFYGRLATHTQKFKVIDNQAKNMEWKHLLESCWIVVRRVHQERIEGKGRGEEARLTGTSALFLVTHPAWASLEKFSIKCVGALCSFPPPPPPFPSLFTLCAPGACEPPPERVNISHCQVTGKALVTSFTN